MCYTHTDTYARSIQGRKIATRTLKQRARKVLELVQKCAKGAPEVRNERIYPKVAR